MEYYWKRILTGAYHPLQRYCIRKHGDNRRFVYPAYAMYLPLILFRNTWNLRLSPQNQPCCPSPAPQMPQLLQSGHRFGPAVSLSPPCNPTPCILDQRCIQRSLFYLLTFVITVITYQDCISCCAKRRITMSLMSSFSTSKSSRSVNCSGLLYSRNVTTSA